MMAVRPCGGGTRGSVWGAEARLGVPVLQAMLPGSLNVVLRQVRRRQGPRGGRQRGQGGLLLRTAFVIEKMISSRFVQVHFQVLYILA